MIKIYADSRKLPNILSMLLSALLVLPLVTSCRDASVPPPVDDSRGAARPYPSAQPTRVNRGMSNGQKVALLAGAAALYYLYNQHKNSQGQGPQGQYYLSKNGRVYYRDAQHRAHWVTPPPEGIQVPEAEAQQYRDFQGYNNSPTGRTLEGMGADQVPAPVPAPAQ